MKPPYEIRLASTSDLANVAALDRLALDSPWPAADYHQTLARRDRLLVVASSDTGELVGFYLALVVHDEAELLKIATAAQLRRQGVAGALLQDMVARCRERGVEHAYLEVRRANEAAISLYRKHGWQPTGERKRYYRDGEDALLMALALV